MTYQIYSTDSITHSDLSRSHSTNLPELIVAAKQHPDKHCYILNEDGLIYWVRNQQGQVVRYSLYLRLVTLGYQLWKGIKLWIHG
jgi:hypothetical protein